SALALLAMTWARLVTHIFRITGTFGRRLALRPGRTSLLLRARLVRLVPQRTSAAEFQALGLGTMGTLISVLTVRCIPRMLARGRCNSLLLDRLVPLVRSGALAMTSQMPRPGERIMFGFAPTRSRFSSLSS